MIGHDGHGPQRSLSPTGWVRSLVSSARLVIAGVMPVGHISGNPVCERYVIGHAMSLSRHCRLGGQRGGGGSVLTSSGGVTGRRAARFARCGRLRCEIARLARQVVCRAGSQSVGTERRDTIRHSTLTHRDRYDVQGRPLLQYRRGGTMHIRTRCL